MLKNYETVFIATPVLSEAQMKEAEMQQQDMLNQRDNDTKLLIAQINAVQKERDVVTDGIIEPEMMNENERETLREKIREFDAKLSLDKQRLEFDKDKHKDEIAVKRMAAKKKTSNSD